jgi:hypothetical protein
MTARSPLLLKMAGTLAQWLPILYFYLKPRTARTLPLLEKARGQEKDY